MKRLTGFLIFFISIFLVIGLLSFLLPSKVSLTKSAEINATSALVRDQITNFEQWKNWYPAFKDENITVIKNPPAQNILNSVTLKDKQGKNITLNLIDSNQNTIDIEVQSLSSTKVSYQFILNSKMDNQIQLTWNVNTSFAWYPWKRIEGIFLDKFSGDQYEAALLNLKKAAEK